MQTRDITRIPYFDGAVTRRWCQPVQPREWCEKGKSPYLARMVFLLWMSAGSDRLREWCAKGNSPSPNLSAIPRAITT